MKNILKLFGVISLVFFSLQTHAQIKYGVKAGLNASNIAFNYELGENDVKTKIRLLYHFGGVMEYSFSDVMSLQTGLIYSAKGWNDDVESYSDDEITFEGYRWYRIDYLEIPMNFTYKMNNFQLFAGPYLAFCIGGKYKYDVTYSTFGIDGTSTGDGDVLAFYNELNEDNYNLEDGLPIRGFDFGMNLGLGYQVGPILLNTGYSLGLGNIIPRQESDEDDDSNDRITNRVITLSASYYFGK